LSEGLKHQVLFSLSRLRLMHGAVVQLYSRAAHRQTILHCLWRKKWKSCAVARTGKEPRMAPVILPAEDLRAAVGRRRTLVVPPSGGWLTDHLVVAQSRRNDSTEGAIESCSSA
jgi:hypothetical protein